MQLEGVINSIGKTIFSKFINDRWVYHFVATLSTEAGDVKLMVDQAHQGKILHGDRVRLECTPVSSKWAMVYDYHPVQNLGPNDVAVLEFDFAFMGVKDRPCGKTALYKSDEVGWVVLPEDEAHKVSQDRFVVGRMKARVARFREGVRVLEVLRWFPLRSVRTIRVPISEVQFSSRHINVRGTSFFVEHPERGFGPAYALNYILPLIDGELEIKFEEQEIVVWNRTSDTLERRKAVRGSRALAVIAHSERAKRIRRNTAFFSDVDEITRFVNKRLSSKYAGQSRISPFCDYAERLFSIFNGPVIASDVSLAFVTEKAVIVECVAYRKLTHVFIRPSKPDLLQLVADVTIPNKYGWGEVLGLVGAVPHHKDIDRWARRVKSLAAKAEGKSPFDGLIFMAKVAGHKLYGV